MSVKHILCITADKEAKTFLETELKKEHFGVDIVESVKAAEKSAGARAPQLQIVDISIPSFDAAIRLLRAAHPVPVIALTGNGQESEKLRAFDAGAADYVMKPLFSPAGLLSRVKAALRYTEKEQAREMTFKSRDLSVDIWRRKVTLHGRDVKLTPIEFDLLAVLIRHAGQVVTQTEMLKEVWGADPEKHGHYLRIYVQRLRDKLGDDPFNPQYLFTEPKIGYRLIGEAA